MLPEKLTNLIPMLMLPSRKLFKGSMTFQEGEYDFGFFEILGGVVASECSFNSSRRVARQLSQNKNLQS